MKSFIKYLNDKDDQMSLYDRIFDHIHLEEDLRCLREYLYIRESTGTYSNQIETAMSIAEKIIKSGPGIYVYSIDDVKDLTIEYTNKYKNDAWTDFANDEESYNSNTKQFDNLYIYIDCEYYNTFRKLSRCIAHELLHIRYDLETFKRGLLKHITSDNRLKYIDIAKNIEQTLDSQSSEYKLFVFAKQVKYMLLPFEEQAFSSELEAEYKALVKQTKRNILSREELKEFLEKNTIFKSYKQAFDKIKNLKSNDEELFFNYIRELSNSKNVAKSKKIVYTEFDKIINKMSKIIANIYCKYYITNDGRIH